MIKIKTVNIDGKKLLERSMNKIIPANDYGVYTIKGSAIKAEANINVGFIFDDNADYVMLKGYLNNKLIPGTSDPAIDSYGDQPTGNNIYDIARLKSNPVVLVNHDNDASGIAGNYIYLSENEQGLQFKLILRPLEESFEDSTKDAISAWSKAWGKAFSIGGKWFYDFENSKPEEGLFILVKAILHEASLVAIGADSYALSVVSEKGHIAEQGYNASCGTLEYAVAKFLESEDDSELVKMVKI